MTLFLNTFQTYDYYNMIVCLLFIGISVLWAGYSIVNLDDSLRFSGEVLMVSCLVTVGLSLFWIIYREGRYGEEDVRLVCAFFVLIATQLLILVTINYNLQKACPECKSR